VAGAPHEIPLTELTALPQKLELNLRGPTLKERRKKEKSWKTGGRKTEERKEKKRKEEQEKKTRRKNREREGGAEAYKLWGKVASWCWGGINALGWTTLTG